VTHASDGFHRIRSLEVHGGFVGSSRMEFASGLNCIIGGRGTGKTTVLEFLRYALDLLPDESLARERSQALHRLLSGNLSAGRVVLDIETKDGMCYRVERSLDEERAIFDQEGGPVSISVPGPLFSAEVYSQNEIEEIANSPRFQLDLLDKFISGPIQQIEHEIEETCRLLATNADQIQSTQRELDGLHDQLSELPDVEEQLKAIERTENGDEDGELRAEHEAKALRDRQARFADDVSKELTRLRERIAAIAADVLRQSRQTQETDLEAGPNADVVTELTEAARTTLTAVHESLIAIGDEIKEGESQVSAAASKLRQQHALQERLYREVLDRFEQEKGKAQERARLLKRQADLQVLDRQRSEAAGKLRKLREERQQLIHALVEHRDQRYRLRLGVAEELNARLTPMIRVQVEQCGNTDRYREMLSELMRNSGLRYTPLVEKAVARIPPEDLAAIVRRDDAGTLAERLDIDRERAQKFIAQLRDHRSLHRVETVELHDRPTIELKDGEDYKDSASLSTGQKCTAILPILLLESEAPLLIDQPEDNLDNAFVFDTVVQSILRVKPKRQLILVTHNPNIPVLGEAERVFVMTSTGKRAQVAAAGTVDELRDDIERLLEGGREAFMRRMERYGH